MKVNLKNIFLGLFLITILITILSLIDVPINFVGAIIIGAAMSFIFPVFE